MIRPLITWILLVTVTTVYSKLKCTKCPFHIEPTGHTNCPETCEGDVCYIVVNAFYNGTKIAGCLNLHEGDKFDGPAICYRQAHQTSCACVTKDHCNAPTAPIANFKFQETPILEGYQLQPLVGGGSGSGSVDSKVTLATLKPDDSIGTPGVKPGDDKYAPSPNAVPISPLPPSTTTTTVTTTPATTATTISSQVVEVATTILSSNESVATKTVDPRVHGNTERTVATTSTTAATVTLTSEGTTEPKTEAPAPHSTKSTTFPFTLAIAIFAVSLIVLVIF